MQNDTHLLNAEELINQEEFKLKTMKTKENQRCNYPNLPTKYSEEVHKVLSQYNLIKDDLKRMNSYTIKGKGEATKEKKHTKCSNTYLDLVERTLNDLENEWSKIVEEGNPK